MEMVGPILELGKMIWAPIRKYYNYHRHANKHIENLKEKWEELKCRKMDVESKMKAEIKPGQGPKQEVNSWLQRVETMSSEMQTIEQEADIGMCFSRMQVGKLACEKIQEVEELYNRGDFRGNLVVDPPASHGEELPTTTLVGESTAERTRKTIWEHLLGEDVRKIGVYGMGGIGKTKIMKHINNDLLNRKDKFDHVIWVTVSKAFNVIKLQNDIACKLEKEHDLLKYEDETTRAGKLHEELKKCKRYVLILDDMWDAFFLEDIGIPEPTSANGCKLILTTRNVEVCNRMGCEKVKMEVLSEEESWKLFLDRVGCDVLNTQDIEPIMKNVVKECARLPLAIITVAGSLKDVVHASEWRNALNELRTSIKEPEHVDAVFVRLQFSYERLKDKKLQDCLLYCALYPEDYKIDRDELIGHLIDEGVIESMNNRQEKLDKGHTMLNKLENACLLEGDSDKKFVKMHDLIRDMAIQIAGSKFMVEAGLGLKYFPEEEKWINDLVKVSLMNNRVSEIPYISPRCPKLSTLLLQGNNYLRSIPDSLFVHLHGLNVLDLSDTNIESLPNSISDLENLTTLRLICCEYLKHVPSLAKLTALRRLDFTNSGIEEIPQGLELLVNLRYLSLFAPNLKKMPPGILPNLSQLQVLIFDRSPKTVRVNGEIARLKKLEIFVGGLNGLDDFNAYVESLEEGGPCQYTVLMGEGYALDGSNIYCQVILNDFNMSLLRIDIQTLRIIKCHNLSSQYKRELNSIGIRNCEELEDIFSYSYTYPLQILEVVVLEDLDNLQVLFREEKVSSAPTIPTGTFSHLRIFSMFGCSNIKKLFSPGLLLNLGNLENIDVGMCEQLEEIIGVVSDKVEEEREAEEIVEEGMDTTIFSQLRYLRLWCLPELKTICHSRNVLVCNSLPEVWIVTCPKLKRLPLSLKGHLPSIVDKYLLPLKIEKKCWELLEWDHHGMKNVLEPFCRFLEVDPDGNRISFL